MNLILKLTRLDDYLQLHKNHRYIRKNASIINKKTSEKGQMYRNFAWIYRRRAILICSRAACIA